MDARERQLVELNAELRQIARRLGEVMGAIEALQPGWKKSFIDTLLRGWSGEQLPDEPTVVAPDKGEH